MTGVFVSAFATLFVVIDPIGAAPIFAGLIGGQSRAERRATALRAVLVAALVLLVFALLGQLLLDALGISLDAFRIAGGVTLFLVALEMIFERTTQRREQQARQVSRNPDPSDVAVFPMAFPMIAGPGSIASVMLLMSGHTWVERAEVLGALLLVLILTLGALLLASPLLKLVGRRIEAVLTRILGVILAALAVQFVIDGIGGSFGMAG